MAWNVASRSPPCLQTGGCCNAKRVEVLGGVVCVNDGGEFFLSQVGLFSPKAGLLLPPCTCRVMKGML